MAKARAIVKRLKAVKNIRKITRTMELIATARFKKAMDRATEAAAYTKKIAEIVADLSAADLQITHPLLHRPDETKNAILLVLTGNRGFCGGYNSSAVRKVMQRNRELTKQGVNTQIEVSGKRGISSLKFEGIETSRSFTEFEDQPRFDAVNEIGQRYADLFIAGKVDRVDVVYTAFENVARQHITSDVLLPFSDLTVAEQDAADTNIDYEFLPSAESILEEIVPAAFKAKLFKCFLDAAVSEQIARMIAMKGATENADEMIDNLSMIYNRARQSQITSELSEIIGGAAALE